MSDSDKAPWKTFSDAIEQMPAEQQASRLARLALQMVQQDQAPAARCALRAREIANLHGPDDQAVLAQALRKFTARYYA